jgi:dihydrofolate reductase
MFGPIRGAWPDESWRGWWGENPPFHFPVVVLTNYPRPLLEMEGNNEIHFCTDGPIAALELAKSLSARKDIEVLGGASTIRQYLEAKRLDDLQIALTPVLLGSGPTLFGGLNLTELGYKLVEHENSPDAMHLALVKG